MPCADTSWVAKDEGRQGAKPVLCGMLLYHAGIASFQLPRVMVRRCKLDPGLKAPLVSKFDCEKGHNSSFNLNLVVFLSLRHYVMVPELQVVSLVGMRRNRHSDWSTL